MVGTMLYEIAKCVLWMAEYGALNLIPFEIINITTMYFALGTISNELNSINSGMR